VKPSKGGIVIHRFQVGAVYARDLSFTATINTVTVHKFQGNCTIQLGDPENGQRQPGITLVKARR
jgi:hypothetical protein